MDIKTFNLLSGTNNLIPMNCLMTEDFFLEKIKGGMKQYHNYFRDIFKNKDYWKILMEWIKIYFKDPKLEKMMVKAIRKKKDDEYILQILQNCFEPFDLFKYQYERKKNILELISKKIDIKGLRVIIYCNEIYTDLFKKLGMDVWREDLEKGVYNICIYDDEISKIPVHKKINMRQYLDLSNYYYYIRNPDVIDETSKSVQAIKYNIESKIFKFPKEKDYPTVDYVNSIEYLIKRFSGELNDNYSKTSHICKIVYQNKLELLDCEIIFKCKPNPNYIEY